jgi:hypothetical protein
LPRGLYEARYTIQYCEMLSSDGACGLGILRFEVCSDLGGTLLSAEAMKLAPGEVLNEMVVTLTFSLKAVVHNIEFRTFASRGISVWQNADVIVTRLSGWKSSAAVDASREEVMHNDPAAR